jgi:predicted nucleic-acid-binding protein
MRAVDTNVLVRALVQDDPALEIQVTGSDPAGVVKKLSLKTNKLNDAHLE